MIGWSARASIEKQLAVASGDVLLVHDPDGDPSRNVFLVDRDTRVLWQIEAATDSHGCRGYSNVYLGPSEELLAYCSNGIEYRIDAASGKVLQRDLIR